MRITHMITYKINLFDILSTSAHYIYRKWIGATNENSDFDLTVWRVKRGPPHNIAHDLLYAGFTALISRATADLTWRSYVGANHIELPRLVPKFPLFRLMLIRVLCVKPTRSWKVISSFCPCPTFSYGHVEIWCIVQLDMYHHSHHFIPSKKTKM